MPINPLAGYVNRDNELALFQRMLRGEVQRRVLLILDRAEQGKTCLLLRLAQECKDSDPPVPVVLLDFDRRHSSITDYTGIGNEVRRALGDARTPALGACLDVARQPVDTATGRTSHRSALLAVLTDQFKEDELFTICFELGFKYDNLHGKGLEGTARELILLCERRGQLDTLWAHLEQRRPSVRGEQVVRTPDTHASGADAPSEVELGQALLDDLAALAGTIPCLVILIDTFEQAGRETCAWLERWLLEPLANKLTHVLVVVAGRPECRALFPPTPRWGPLVETLQHLNALSDEDILAHYELRGVPLPPGERTLFQIARLSPAKMAQVGDLLLEARGGGA
jgi:hypothetical protein